MLTAALSAAIIALLSAFGIRPGAAQIAGIVVAVKVVVVAATAFIAWRVSRRRKPSPTPDPPTEP